MRTTHAGADRQRRQHRAAATRRGARTAAAGSRPRRGAKPIANCGAPSTALAWTSSPPSSRPPRWRASVTPWPPCGGRCSVEGRHARRTCATLRSVAPPARARLVVRLAAVLAGGSLLAAWLEPRQLDWQPRLALTQPWRCWSAAWVHWSEGHRWANIAGAALVGALGWRAHCDRLDSMAWFVAWPLTQLGLLLQPSTRPLRWPVRRAACGVV